MKKILGYILAILGLIGVAMWAVPGVGDYVLGLVMEPAEDGTFPVSLTIPLIVGAALAILGVLIVTKGGRGRRSKVSEVPIYHGNQVVGYRRHAR